MYEKKFKHIKTTLQIFINLIDGKYVNFKVCEYYGDMSFIELSKIVFTVVTMQDAEELKQYERLYRKALEVFYCFTKSYSNSVFEHFDIGLSISVLDMATFALQNDSVDVLQCATGTIANLFTFAFETVTKAESGKESVLSERVKSFMTEGSEAC